MTARRLLVLVLLLLAGCAPKRGDDYMRSLAEARRAHHAGRFAEAAVKFDDAARTAKIPRDAVYARYEAALARARAGDHARASQELRALAEQKPPHAYSALAAFKAADLAWDSDPSAGYVELEAVAIAHAESGVARSALLRVVRHDDENGGPAKALTHLDAILPRVSGTKLEETVAYERAKRLAELDRSKEARDAYLEIAGKWPYPKGSYFDDALYRASEMEEKLGRPNEAIAHLEHLLRFRETASLMGSYERPRYLPAALRIAKLYEETLHDRAKARETLHRVYRDFKTSTLRDDVLWREAELWKKDGDAATACNRLATLASDFPDSRYVPCVEAQCPGVKRKSKSKAPKECHAYLLREPQPEREPLTPGTDSARPDQ
jgi:tetratricopeptide (TPR) repeat protein